MKNKITYTVFLLLMAIGGFSQQSAIYSQYMFNPFMVNPAYAGSRDALSGGLLFRQQWVGIDGAPVTQTFSMHSMVGKTNLAAGLNAINDQIGPSRHTGFLLTGAYHLPLSKGKLAFGIRGGIYSAYLDNTKLNYDDPTDVMNTQNRVNGILPAFDGGLYYYSRKFYLGFAVTQLNEPTYGYKNYPAEAAHFLKRHYLLSSGYAFELSEKLVFKPSTLIKYVEGAPVNVDLNVSFLLNKKYWLGASYRTGNGLTFIADFYLTDWFRLGYSYDMVMNRLKKYTQGTHEISIGFDLNIKRTKYISTRFM